MPVTPDQSAGTGAGDASSGPTAAAAVCDDVHDSKEIVLRRYFLQEWELVSAILRRIVAAGGIAEPADVHRIRSIDYLSNSGPMRRMSGLLLARLLTRPDMLKAFSSFMEWAHKILLSVTDDFVDQFRSIGIVEALASIFKSVSSSLGANLVSSAAVSSSGSTQQVNIDQTETCGLEEDMDVPEIVEEIIDLLLTGLRDSDTIVRWSAAKGVGRITARLTPALSEEVLSSILQLFSPGEVNCRRAASAAFQENVGRQGTYPHGIDIVNTTDYFALASRSNSYLSVAVSVAQYKEYVYPFAEELLCNKITHWERSLRELAQALALLVQYDMDYFSGHALKKLIPCTLSSDLCTRHGATLAAGEIALKLHQLGFILQDKADDPDAEARALDDYAVDNRGDVGSWVREAAMDALERCTFILCKRDAVAVRAAPAAEDESEPSDMDANAISITYQLFDSAIVQDLVAGIAKQAVEKIDKIREIAVRALQRILYNQEQFVPSIPYRKLLEEIIPNNSDLEWAVPTVSYPRLVKILQASCYSKPVLSGLVISTGGLQESLRKASTSALVGYLQDSSINIDDEGKSREYLLSRDILWVLQRYQKCDRVITPTLKTIETLLSKQVFLNKEGHGDFYSELINLLGPELKGSKDFTKLCAGLSILGYISSQLDGTGTKAFSQLLVFLGHRYPKIRKAAADQVYLVLLQNDSLISAEDMDKAQEVLAETCWEGDVEEARHKRSELNVMAGFGIAASDKSENRQGARTPDVRNAASTDENTSYSSLVEFSGY
ncbi:hypothetical protein ZWY2020_042343 [Hordeum vulgare]|nr:hypothetical protein ZWY2020_042343 [Hordeum vulgare]